MLVKTPVWCLAIGLLAALGCRRTGSTPGSEVKTDLGPGNIAVRDKLKRYFDKDSSQHCDSSGTGVRVLFSGFSVFQDFPYNISGTVVRAMATPELWAKDLVLASFDPTGRARLGATSLLAASDEGGRATQRQLTIDGTPVSVCFVLLEVVWDQAAGILLDEIRRFHPEKILMTGGGVSVTPLVGQFEGGAINRAFALTGYGTDGRPLPQNLPVASSVNGDEAPILPPDQPGVQPAVPMRWDGEALALATRPLVRLIRKDAATQVFDVVAFPAARPSNTYLCNNVSFVILHALRGVPLSLAGGLVQAAALPDTPPYSLDGETLKLNLGAAVASTTTTAGFFHIPDTGTDEAQTMLGWAKVFAKIMLEPRAVAP